MKIGIITFHASINHGAFLQVYSTYKFLQENGFDVSIVNYMSKKRYWAEKKQLLLTKNPISLFYNLTKINTFRKSHKNLKLEKLVFDISKVRDLYDVFIVGSDIVWDFSNPISGIDLTYFGKGLEEKKLVAYGASFGSINTTTVIPYYIRNYLNNFSYISVRDESSFEIIKKLTGKTSEIVLDPTFLIDYKSCGDLKEPDKNYLLIYAYYVPKVFRVEIINFAREKGLKIISVGYRNEWADKNVNVDPFEWITYIKHARYIITSTFHGTVFSIKYNKEFFTILTGGNTNKTLSLLNQFALQARASNTTSVVETFKNHIDYTITNKFINQNIEKSKEYLLSALKK